MKNKTCVVYGYLNCNVGDDLFFEVLAKRYPRVDFFLFPPSTLLPLYIKMFKHNKNIKFYDRDPKYIQLRKEIPDPNIILNTYPIMCDKIGEADIFINLGGSIFIQNENWQNDDRKLLLELAKGKPSFIIGSNFGPYYSKEYLNYYRQWFVQFKDVCFRDRYSYQLFSDLKNTRVAHDIILGTKRPCLVRTKKKTLGISVIDLENRKDLKNHETQYIAFLSKTIEKFIKEGYKITLYSFCDGEGDLKGIHKVLNALDKNIDQSKIKIVSHRDDIRKFRRDFAKNEYIIGTRFHSIVLAIINGQSVLPMIYNEKTEHMLNDLDEQIETLDIKEIIGNDSLEKMLKFQKIDFSNSKNTASEQFEILDQYLS